MSKEKVTPIKLKSLASKPKLIPVVLDDEQTIKTMGAPVEFMTWDRQSLPDFMRMAAAREENPKDLFEMVSKLVLDDDGKPIIVDEECLPNSVMVSAVHKVVSILGNS